MEEGGHEQTLNHASTLRHTIHDWTWHFIHSCRPLNPVAHDATSPQPHAPILLKTCTLSMLHLHSLHTLPSSSLIVAGCLCTLCWLPLYRHTAL